MVSTCTGITFTLISLNKWLAGKWTELKTGQSWKKPCSDGNQSTSKIQVQIKAYGLDKVVPLLLTYAQNTLLAKR